MEFTAVLVKMTAIETINGQSGEWTQRTVLFQTIGDRYPREIAVTVRNEMCKRVEAYQQGNLLKVQVDASSREHEGRYYTELRAWSMKPAYTFAPEVHEEETTEETPPANTQEKMLDANGEVQTV